MAAVSSSPSSVVYSNIVAEDDRIRTNSSHSSVKRQRCSLWSCISNIMSRCFKNYSTNIKEGIVLSVENLNDPQVRKISVILKEGKEGVKDELRYELVWKKRRCIQKKPLIGLISYIPGYNTSKMIQYLMNCEIRNSDKAVSFLREHHSWVIKSGKQRTLKIDLIQHSNILLYRITKVNHPELYIPIKSENENIPLKDRIKSLSRQELIVGNNSIPELASVYAKKIINGVEVSLLVGRESLVWQSKRQGINTLYQDVAIGNDIQYIRNGEIALKFNPLPMDDSFFFAQVYKRLIDFHPKELQDKLEVSLLVAERSLIWQIYEKSTKIFHQQAETTFYIKDPEQYWSEIENRNIEIVESIKDTVRILSVSPSSTKVSKISQIDGRTIFNADEYAVTLVNSGTSRADPFTWAGHAKIVFEFIENKEHKILEAHFISEFPFVILQPPPRSRTYPERTRTYIRPKNRVQRLLTEMRRHIPSYSLGGGNILASTTTKGSMISSNCITWAIDQLEKIDIKVELPSVGIVDTVIEQVIARPIQYTRSSSLRGQESVKFYYDITVPIFIRYSFPARQSISLEKLIQERVGPRHWHVVSDSNWISSQDSAQNSVVVLAKQLKRPILISVNVEGKVRQLDFTKEILAEIKKIPAKIKKALSKSDSALGGLANLFDSLNTMIGGKPEFEQL